MSARVLFTSRVCIYRKEEEEEEAREKRNITEKSGVKTEKQRIK